MTSNTRIIWNGAISFGLVNIPVALPPEGSVSAGLTERELSMAMQLVDSMSAPWEPDKFKDSFTAEVMALVDKKVKAGKTESVIHPEVEPASTPTADIIDFTELLRRSLHRENVSRTENPPARAKTASGAQGLKEGFRKRPQAPTISKKRSRAWLYEENHRSAFDL